MGAKASNMISSARTAISEGASYINEHPRSETYSRIGLLLRDGNLQSYWTTTKLLKLTVVLVYYETMKTYSRIRLLLGDVNLQSFFSSLRTLSAVGGAALTIVSILGCFALFNTLLNPVSYILNLFYLTFGLIIVFVELFPQSNVTDWIFREMNILRSLNGRAVFYLYIGKITPVTS
jgi:hypothetical protein